MIWHGLTGGYALRCVDDRPRVLGLIPYRNFAIETILICNWLIGKAHTLFADSNSKLSVCRNNKIQLLPSPLLVVSSKSVCSDLFQRFYFLFQMKWVGLCKYKFSISKFFFISIFIRIETRLSIGNRAVRGICMLCRGKGILSAISYADLSQWCKN